MQSTGMAGIIRKLIFSPWMKDLVAQVTGLGHYLKKPTNIPAKQNKYDTGTAGIWRALSSYYRRVRQHCLK